MNTHKNNTAKLIFSSMLCASLVACGSSSDDVIEDVIEETLSGVVVDESNFQDVFQTGVLDSAKLAAGVMFAGNEIDTSLMTIAGVTESSYIYDCDNTDGTVEVTKLDDTTERWDFDNCHITTYQPDSSYDGTITISTDIISGAYDDIGSYNDNWSVSQAVSMLNFTQTSPINGGNANTSNGSYILDSSNSLDTELNISTMSSTNLIIDSMDSSTFDTTTYTFSDIYYDLQEDIIDESLQSDLDFTADITDIGDIQVTTEPTLVYDTGDLLQSGTVTATTGNSSAKMVAIGNDSVTISIDTDNDGDYDFDVPTTWSEIGG